MPNVARCAEWCAVEPISACEYADTMLLLLLLVVVDAVVDGGTAGAPHSGRREA